MVIIMTNKINEKDMKNTKPVENKDQQSELEEKIAQLEADNKKLQEEKKDVDNKAASMKVEKDEARYTTSPDGKYKIPVSEYNSDRLEENQQNIPTITIPGWVVVWPHDIKPSTIQSMVNKGWQFVSSKEPGCEAAGRKIVAGRTAAGETAFHYAMKMPESKYKELTKREEEERKAYENSIKQTPNDKSSAIYATDDMKFDNPSNRESYAKMS